jgi:hypothetical protein
VRGTPGKGCAFYRLGRREAGEREVAECFFKALVLGDESRRKAVVWGAISGGEGDASSE